MYKKNVYPYIAVGFGYLIAIAANLKNIAITWFYIPYNWHLPIIDSFINPISVILFPWNGWIFIAPSLIALATRRSFYYISTMWLITSITYGFIHAYLHFDHFTVRRGIIGSFTYMFIFGFTFVTCLALYLTIKMIHKIHKKTK